MTRKSKSARLWLDEKEDKKKKIRQKYLEAKKAKEFLKNLAER
jgi:hypothetical protein